MPHCGAARETILGERQLVLGTQAWDAFTAEISRSGRHIQGVADLIRHPSVFSDE